MLALRLEIIVVYYIYVNFILFFPVIELPELPAYIPRCL